MTKRERFLAFANFEAVDRVPRHAGYTADMQKVMAKLLGGDPHEVFDDDGWYGCPLLRGGKAAEPIDATGYYPEYEDGKDGFYIDGAGVGHINVEGSFFPQYVPPLRNARSFADIEGFPIGSNEGWSDAGMREVGAEAQAAGKAASTFVGSIYEGSWHLRGQAEFMMDLLEHRDWAEYLLDRHGENTARSAAAAAGAGYDRIAISDDVANQNAMMFSPSLWREVFKPRMARVIAAATDIKPDIHVWYHTDGNVWEILDDLVEIGVTILNPVQPECMDPLAVRKRLGRRMAFDGCVGTQTTFPFGTADDVRARVRELIAGLDGLAGGLTLSPTHAIVPGVPPENVIAFFDEIDATRRREEGI